MRELTSFIKIDRNIQKWRWFKDPNTLSVWLWLLLNASLDRQDYKEIRIERGQVCATYSKIAEDTGLSIKSTRTAIDHLIKTGEITKIGQTQNYPVYNIVEFSRYQGKPADLGQTTGRPAADPGQTSGRPRATLQEVEENKEYKNYKKGKNARAREAPEPEEKFDFFGYLDQVIAEEEAKERAKHEQAGNNADN